jgi:Tfp pilus assembly protein PilO
MKFNKLTQALISLGVVLVALLLAHLTLKGTYRNIEANKARIAELEQDINIAKAIQQQAAVLQDEMVHLKAQLDRLKKILPVDINEPKFLADMKRIANENGIEIVSLSTNHPVKNDVIIEHPYSFETRGNYHDFGRFFSQLTNYQRIINVKALHLFREEDSPAYSVDGYFLISVFTYKEPTAEDLRKQIDEKKGKKSSGKKKRRK